MRRNEQARRSPENRAVSDWKPQVSFLITRRCNTRGPYHLFCGGGGGGGGFLTVPGLGDTPRVSTSPSLTGGGGLFGGGVGSLAIVYS